MSTWKKGVKVVLMTLLIYLLQGTVMGKLAINSVTGNLMLVWIAVMTVSLGKKYAFCAGALYGILVECMRAPTSLIYLLMYPIVATAVSFVFADMSDKQRESRYVSAKKKRTDDLPALLRIPLCALVMETLFQVVGLVYIYLRGTFAMMQVARSLLGMVYTAVLAALLMLPLRWYIGMYSRPKEASKGGVIL